MATMGGPEGGEWIFEKKTGTDLRFAEVWRWMEDS